MVISCHYLTPRSRLEVVVIFWYEFLQQLTLSLTKFTTQSITNYILVVKFHFFSFLSSEPLFTHLRVFHETLTSLEIDEFSSHGIYRRFYDILNLLLNIV